MKKFTPFLLLICLWGVLALSVTISAQSDTECPLTDGVLNIAWIPKALDNAVFELGRVGAETRAEELTAEDLPCDVEVFVAAPMNTDATEQADLLMEVIDTGEFDAIAVSCITPDACFEALNRATAEGIAAMTWDSDSPDSDRFTYYGTDNTIAGAAAADLLIRAMGETGKIGILSGVATSQNLNARVQGFADGIENYPNVEIVSILYGNDDGILSADLIEEFLSATPDVTGIFFAGLWPFTLGRGAMPTWEEQTLEGRLVNIAFDTLPLELVLVNEGLVQGLVGQKYWDWGYGSVSILYDAIINDVEFESFTDTGFDIVTINNVEAALQAWESNDFTQPLPDPFMDANAIDATPEATEASS